MFEPGWYHAQGDPAGTVRYWDGNGWVGAAIAPEQRQTAGGYDLIAPQEVLPPVGMASVAVARPGEPPTGATGRAANPADWRRWDRLIIQGLFLLLAGMAMGIAGHNVVTLFSTPTEVEGRVTEFRETQVRRNTFRIEVTTEVGEFYHSSRVRSYSSAMRQALRSNADIRLTVLYSERTGGLIAIKEFGGDRRSVGRFLWPAVAVVASVIAAVKIRHDFRVYRDPMVVGGLALLCFVIGPLLGGFVIFDTLATVVDTTFSAP